MHRLSRVFLAGGLLVAVSFAGEYARTDITGKPNSVDSLMQGREPKLDSVDTKLRIRSGDVSKLVKTGEPTSSSSKSEGFFQIQFDAVADFDAAQKRREELQRRTGYSIQLVFDAPFYKLRAGGWSQKEQAEDKVAELAGNNVTAFVVKVK